MKEIIAIRDLYVICHNNLDIIHCIYLKKGHKLTTGQPFIEERATLEEAEGRVNQIAKNSTYFATHCTYVTGE